MALNGLAKIRKIKQNNQETFPNKRESSLTLKLYAEMKY